MKKWMKRLGLGLAAFCTAWMLWGMDAKAEVIIYTNGEIFDAEFYAAAYPDVAAVIGTDPVTLLQHYMAHGQKEGRLPYAAYGSGVSPFTGIPDIPLATEFHTHFDTTDPVLQNYLYQAAQTGWDHWDDHWNCNYKDKLASYYWGESMVTGEKRDVTAEMLTVGYDYRHISYMPAVRTDMLGGEYVACFGAELLQNHPEFGFGWYIATSDEESDTWLIKSIMGQWDEQKGRFSSYRDKVSWDVLRNVLRWISPDGEELFKMAVRMHYDCVQRTFTGYDYGNFHAVGTGSTLAMVDLPDFGDVMRFRENTLASKGVDIEAVYQVLPSQSVQIPVATVKRTSIDVNDPYLKAYKNAYDPWGLLSKCGTDTLNPENLDTMSTLDFGALEIEEDSIYSVHEYLTDGTIWLLQYNSEWYDIPQKNNSWCLRIPGYLTELECDALHQALRHVSPDAEALYAKIMQNETRQDLPLNRWIKVGNSSLYVFDGYGGYYYSYYFK